MRATKWEEFYTADRNSEEYKAAVEKAERQYNRTWWKVVRFYDRHLRYPIKNLRKPKRN